MQLKLPISKRRVQQILSNDPNLDFRKMTVEPNITPKHAKNRLSFALSHVSRGPEFWSKVAFSDEKKFTLDGPVGCPTYWRDKRKQNRTKPRRQMGGGSVMLWGAISIHGKSELKFVKPRSNSRDYINTLQTGLMPFAAEVWGESTDWVFQQDGASIHTSKETSEWIEDKNITVLPWPSMSPDLNIIENIWAYMAQRVYDGDTVYLNKNQLMVAIQEVWDNISEDYLKNLYNSIGKRLVQVIERKGKATDY